MEEIMEYAMEYGLFKRKKIEYNLYKNLNHKELKSIFNKVGFELKDYKIGQNDFSDYIDVVKKGEENISFRLGIDDFSLKLMKNNPKYSISDSYFSLDRKNQMFNQDKENWRKFYFVINKEYRRFMSKKFSLYDKFFALWIISYGEIFEKNRKKLHDFEAGKKICYEGQSSYFCKGQLDENNVEIARDLLQGHASLNWFNNFFKNNFYDFGLKFNEGILNQINRKIKPYQIAQVQYLKAFIAEKYNEQYFQRQKNNDKEKENE